MNPQRNWLPYWLTAPGVLMTLAFVALPLVITLSLSLYPFLPGGGVGDQMTIANYADVARDDYFHVIFARTFGMAILVTLLCIVIGVPEAYVLSRLSARWRTVSKARRNCARNWTPVPVVSVVANTRSHKR